MLLHSQTKIQSTQALSNGCHEGGREGGMWRERMSRKGGVDVGWTKTSIYSAGLQLSIKADIMIDGLHFV